MITALTWEKFDTIRGPEAACSALFPEPLERTCS